MPLLLLILLVALIGIAPHHRTVKMQASWRMHMQSGVPELIHERNARQDVAARRAVSRIRLPCGQVSRLPSQVLQRSVLHVYVKLLFFFPPFVSSSFHRLRRKNASNSTIGRVLVGKLAIRAHCNGSSNRLCSKLTRGLNHLTGLAMATKLGIVNLSLLPSGDLQPLLLIAGL